MQNKDKHIKSNMEIQVEKLAIGRNKITMEVDNLRIDVE
jgi:hypothetical protein